MIVDAIIVAFVGFAVWRGWHRGLLASLAGFAGFILATVAAVFAYPIFMPAFRALLHLSTGVANVVSALSVFLVVSLMAFILGRELTKALQLTKWGTLNAAGGSALSGLWSLSWVTAVVLALSVVPAPKAIASNLERSRLARGIQRDAPSFTRALARTDVRQMLAPLFKHSDEKVAIKATLDFRRVPEDERLLFDLVNEERRARSLPVLAWDERLAQEARSHAAEMYARGYFAHDTPEGLTPGARLRRDGVPFVVTGENIALAPTILIAHNRLMASARHRAHILGARFDRVGIGVMYGRQGLLLAEEFAG